MDFVDTTAMTNEQVLSYKILQCQQLFAAIIETYGKDNITGKTITIPFAELEKVYMHARVEVEQDNDERCVRLRRAG